MRLTKRGGVDGSGSYRQLLALRSSALFRGLAASLCSCLVSVEMYGSVVLELISVQVLEDLAALWTGPAEPRQLHVLDVEPWG